MVDNEGFQTVCGAKKRSRAMRSPSGEGSPSVGPMKVRSRKMVTAASPSSENRFRSLEPGHESDDELDASQEAVVIRDNAAAAVAARKSGQGKRKRKGKSHGQGSGIADVMLDWDQVPEGLTEVELRSQGVEDVVGRSCCRSCCRVLKVGNVRSELRMTRSG